VVMMDAIWSRVIGRLWCRRARSGCVSGAFGGGLGDPPGD
jgi:hypothetical protein